MFIREYKTHNKKTNTIYVTHRLVEAYRMEKGTRQRIILHLGTLTLPRAQWRDLAIILESGLSGRQITVEMDSELHKIADKTILHSNLIQKHRTEKEDIKKPDKVTERIGRIRQKYSGVSKYYEIDLHKEEELVVAISWKLKENKKTSSVLDGCYVIETTHKELNEYEIWKLYTTLTRVESAFRALKSELGLRPIYHQNTERTQGHLFISVLAYHLLITINNLLAESGDTREWTTIKNILSTHQRSTVILRDENQGVHHLRINGMPEGSQKEIYEKLDIRNILKTDHRIAKLSMNA